MHARDRLNQETKKKQIQLDGGLNKIVWNDTHKLILYSGLA